ncbi:MAG: RHS repeat-associated core domain-containing protein, partial [Chitinophagaceae bacterium]
IIAAAYLQRNDFSSSNNWTKNKMDFSVAGIQYDVNGNLKRMEQEGVSFSGIVQMDRLNYEYYANSNQLKWVAEDVPTADYKLHDFTDKNSGIDYTYDKSGNLQEDKNKGISDIKYNTLGFTELVTFDNNRGTIKYVYDALGNKLQKIVTDNTVTNNPPLITVTSYNTQITYTGKEPIINFEEGRVRLTRKVNTLVPTAFAFDYYVKDYVGNVRMVLTDDPEYLNPYPYARMENATAGNEDKYYNITNRTPKPAALTGSQAYDDRYGQQMSKLSSAQGNNKIGPSILLKVMAGDIVHAETDYYYQSNGTQVNSGSLLADLVTNLISHLNGGNAGFTAKHEAATIGSGVQGDNLVGALIADQNNHYSNPLNSNRPRAFLNYIVFNEQFQAIAKGFLQVENPGPLQAPLVRTDINIDKNGWIYVFANNESQQDVYFDNFRVIHARGNILEETHYYPFGLAMNAISSRALAINPVNKIKHSGKELQNEEFSDGTSLNRYDFGARMYDLQIGRWMAVDPASEKMRRWSPFNYTFNNPTRFIDPDGNEPTSTNVRKNADGTYTVVGGNLHDKDRGIYIVDANGKRTGEKIGVSATMYSFYNADVHDPIEQQGWKGTINPKSMEGVKWYNSKIRNSTPDLVGYMMNASDGKKYDLKRLDPSGVPLTKTDARFNDRNYHHRGMYWNKEADGTPIYGSARDFGNTGAGFVAGWHSLGWETARVGFQALESGLSGGQEAAQSILAQRIGWLEGHQWFHNSFIGDMGPMGQVFGQATEYLKFW